MSELLDAVIIGLLVALTLVIYRLLRGPSLVDRAIASEQISIHVVALTAVYSIISAQAILLDLVIITAIVGFLSVAVVGIFIERAARGKAHAELGD